MAPPITRYTKHGDVSIAYQVVGEGPVDLVFVPGFISHLDLWWTLPDVTAMFRRLASFSRLILFDKPGTGVSDPIAYVPSLEERMEDVRAVLDATGSEKAVLFGYSEGAPMSLLFAATYPERAIALALYGSQPPTIRRDVYDDGVAEDVSLGFRAFEEVVERWGEGRLLDVVAPSLAGSDSLRRTVALFERAAASPAMARALIQAAQEIDVTGVLESIRVPTVVMHRTGEVVPIAAARWMADRIPGARFVELDGIDHLPWVGDMASVADEIEELVTGARRGHEPDRALVTLLFTDIVGSTRTATELGDRAWRELLERHDELVREQVVRFRGRELKRTGDGFLTMFDGPARAIRCAKAVAAPLAELGVHVRAGIHTGEVELLGDDVAGVAVHIAARVAALAGPDDVLVSRTVRDLVTGSALAFEDRGEHELAGVPDRWRLFALSGDRADDRADPALAHRAPSPTLDRVQLAIARRAPGLGRLATGRFIRATQRRG
ncbi:MAG TPA: adenylate/guanylate cyclase domain-containing protein [Solirubrobacteraceae bacterium]|nr:adenylate/guanylate cyclase domain-containing protein [Solirubrobacteraceae bacterium]